MAIQPELHEAVWVSKQSEVKAESEKTNETSEVSRKGDNLVVMKGGTFLMCDGALPAGDDILIAKMSISKARARCRELPGCEGFTYEVVTGEPLVHFKSKWELKATPGKAWISYRYVTAFLEQEPVSADLLVHKALQPDSNVGFPQITEICERLEANPEEIPDVVSLLVGVLRGRLLRGPKSFQLKLKALTIICEMLYNPDVVPWFSSTHGFSSAIKELRVACDTALGETADSSIRVLATEIDKVCSDSDLCSTCSSSSSCSSSGSTLQRLASGLQIGSFRRKVKAAVKMATVSRVKASAQSSFAETLKVAPRLPAVSSLFLL